MYKLIKEGYTINLAEFQKSCELSAGHVVIQVTSQERNGRTYSFFSRFSKEGLEDINNVEIQLLWAFKRAFEDMDKTLDKKGFIGNNKTIIYTNKYTRLKDALKYFGYDIEKIKSMNELKEKLENAKLKNTEKAFEDIKFGHGCLIFKDYVGNQYKASVLEDNLIIE